MNLDMHCLLDFGELVLSSIILNCLAAAGVPPLFYGTLPTRVPLHYMGVPKGFGPI